MNDADWMRPWDTDAMSSPRLVFETGRPDEPQLPNVSFTPPSRPSTPLLVDLHEGTQTTRGSNSTGERTSPTLRTGFLNQRFDPFGFLGEPSYVASEIELQPVAFKDFSNMFETEPPSPNLTPSSDLAPSSYPPRTRTSSKNLNKRGTELFECDRCPRRFHLRDLVSHERTHLAIKNSPCRICHKVYSTKGKLNKHLRRGCGKVLEEQEHKHLESRRFGSPFIPATRDGTADSHMDHKPPFSLFQRVTNEMNKQRGPPRYYSPPHPMPFLEMQEPLPIAPSASSSGASTIDFMPNPAANALFKKTDGTKATPRIDIREGPDAPPREIQTGMPDHGRGCFASPRTPSACSRSASTQQSESFMVSDSTDDDAVSVITDYSGHSVMGTENVQGSPAQTYLRAFGLEVARNVLLRIRTILDSNSGFTSCPAGSSSISRSKNSSSQTSTSNSRSGSVGKKRAREDDGSEPPGDGSGNGPNKRRNIATLPDDSLLLKRLLACPFYKRNPDKHKKWRSCAGPGWQTIHRLKEHIYRRHALPVVCPRCGTQYETEEEMQKHSKQPIPCEVSEAEATDGYNKEQEKQLRGRKRPANQTDEQRWYDMYTILFPKDPPLLVPSPYYESQEMQIQGQLVKFKDYLKDELPKKMWTDLQSDLQPLSDAEMINMQKRIEEMVHECTDGFFLQCQRSFLSPPSTPLPSEPQRRIPSSPLQSDSLSEDSGMSNQLIPLATAVPANPTRTGISDLEFEEMLPSRDGSGYIQPPVPTAFTAYTASPIVPAPTAFTANITYPARPSTPDSNRRRGFTNQSIWNPPYLASSDPVMGQYGTMNSGDDGANLDFDQIMFSMGPMDSGHWIQPPASGYS